MEIAESKKPGSLKARAVRRMGVTLVVLGALLFVPAGSVRFWQGWLYLLLMVASWVFFFVSLWRRDPKLLERRLQSKESQPEQRFALKLFSMVLYAGFILAGLDFRLGWSQARVGRVPAIVVVAAEIVVGCGYWLVFWVMKTNTFAGSTIQVEPGHRVIDSGPYALVRHPMYTGMVVTSLATPLALGSYVTLPVFALMVPVLAYRLIHEERVLCRELPGYAEYCERTRFRLLPRVW